MTPDLADSLGVKPDTRARWSPRRPPNPRPPTAGVKVGDVIEAVERRGGGRSARSRPPHRRVRPEEDRDADAVARRQGAEDRRDAGRDAVRQARWRPPNRRAEADDEPETELAKLGLELEAAKGGGVKVVSASKPDSAAAERGHRGRRRDRRRRRQGGRQTRRCCGGARRRQGAPAASRCFCRVRSRISRCASWLFR